MSKLLVVFGATGNQGGSTIDFVLSSPQLSKEYKLRGLSRDPSSSSSQALAQKGVEMLKYDSSDPSLLKSALSGAHTVFAVTSSIYSPEGKAIEYAEGKAIADATVAAGAKYLIWSSMTDVTKVTDGKLTTVDLFDVKADVETYIRTLPIKSSFYAPGSFMSNFLGQQKPKKQDDGSYTLANILSSKDEIPLVDINGDTGKFTGAILAEPDKYEGKFFAAATRLYSMSEIAEIMSKVSGKTVNHKQLPDEVFKSFFPPSFAGMLIGMFQLFRGYGYYGKDSKQMVEWTAKQAAGPLTEFEEFLRKVDFKLE